MSLDLGKIDVYDMVWGFKIIWECDEWVWYETNITQHSLFIFLGTLSINLVMVTMN